MGSRFFKWFLVFVVVLLAAFGFLFLNKKRFIKKPVADNKLPIVKIAAAPPAVPHLLAEVMKMNGFDKEEGFQIEIVGVDPTQTVAALVNNTVDVAVIGVIPAVSINSENQNIEVFAPALKLSCPFYVNGSSPLSNMSQLIGMRLGTPTKAGATYPLLATIYKKQGIDIEKQYKVVEGEFFQLPTMLLDGSVDVTTGICDEISYSKAVSQGKLKSLGTIDDLAKQAYGKDSNLILSGFGAKKEWIDSHPALAKGFVNAFNKSAKYINDNPQIFANDQIVSLYQLTPDQITSAQNFVKTNQNYVFADWGQTITSLDAVINDAYKFGYIKQLPTRDVFIQVNQ